MSAFILNPDSQEMLFGVVYFLLSTLLFPLFAIVMMALHSKTRHVANMTYSIMNMILLTELIQVICHFVTSPIFVFPQLQHDFASVVSIFGVVLNTFWIFEFPATTILAVCRVLIFNDFIKSQKMPLVLKTIIGLIAFLLFIMLIVCYETGSFISSPPGWKYDENAPYTQIFQLLEVLIVFPCLTINYASYILIAFLIYKKKRGSTVHSRKNEAEILIQYTILTVYTTLSIIAWHKGELWFDLGDAKIQAFINALWIIGCAFNPVLTVLLSRSIREECLRMIHWRKKMTIEETALPQLAFSGNHLFAYHHSLHH